MHSIFLWPKHVSLKCKKWKLRTIPVLIKSVHVKLNIIILFQILQCALETFQRMRTQNNHVIFSIWSLKSSLMDLDITSVSGNPLTGQSSTGDHKMCVCVTCTTCIVDSKNIYTLNDYINFLLCTFL